MALTLNLILLWAHGLSVSWGEACQPFPVSVQTVRQSIKQDVGQPC